MNGSRVEIVIVEDNPDDAELIARVLRKHHLDDGLLLLTDGAEAIAFFFAEHDPRRYPHSLPKVIFLDWKLPKVHGDEVLKRLKSDERTRTIPVVVLTSSTEQRDLRDAYALGANGYVAKPIHHEEFAKAVGELATYWLRLNKPCD